MDKRLEELQQRELDKLDIKRMDITEKIYPSLEDAIKRTSELSGIDPDVLVSACVSAAWHYQSLEWHNILDIINSVYLAKKRIEGKREK